MNQQHIRLPASNPPEILNTAFWMFQIALAILIAVAATIDGLIGIAAVGFMLNCTTVMSLHIVSGMRDRRAAAYDDMRTRDSLRSGSPSAILLATRMTLAREVPAGVFHEVAMIQDTTLPRGTLVAELRVGIGDEELPAVVRASAKMPIGRRLSLAWRLIRGEV